MTRSLNRRRCIVAGCILFLVACGNNGSNEVAEKETPAPNAQFIDDTAVLIAEADAMFKKGHREQAQEFVDQAIKYAGETVELLEYKDDLLWSMDRFEDRIENVLRLEEINERKSPWYCLKLAESYLHLNQYSEAISWLERAVEERGFRRPGVFQMEVYDQIRNDDRFLAVIARTRENMGIGKPVPDIAVTLLDGKEFTLSSLEGKVTLLDFWASWCVPCRREMPNLKELFDEFNAQGFEIVGISLDEDKEKTMEYIKANGLSWRISCSERGWQDESAKLYMVNSLPSGWLIDRNGVLRHFNLKGEELRAGVQQLLSEATH